MKILQILAVYLFCCFEIQAQITDQQIKNYARDSWELADLTDDVLTETLNSNYNGIPYKNWIKFYLSAKDIKVALTQGDYRGAATIAYEKALNKSIESTLAQAGLGGVSAYAQMAYWPIGQGISGFQQAVANASFKKQLELYFQARAVNSAQAIRDLAPSDILSTATNVVSKSDDGWLFRNLSYLYGAVPNYTPHQFFAHAEKIWLASEATATLDGTEREVAGSFRTKATAEAPMIITDLLDVEVNEGQSGTFTVVARGDDLRYFWFVNGQAYTGNNSIFTLSIPGTYQVQVANDLGRVTSRTATLRVIPKNGVSFIQPTANAIVSGRALVKVNAPSATKVEFLLNGVVRSTDSASPFEWSWETTAFADGSHQLVAKAYNAGTLLGTSPSRAVSVNNSSAVTGGDSDLFEPNNSSPSATTMAPSTNVQARISSPSDVDWFKFDATQPGALTLNLAVPPGLDYDLEIYGPSGSFLNGSYQDKGENETATVAVPQAGTYLARVYGYPVGAGAWSTTLPYTLTSSFSTGEIVITSPPQAVSIPWGAAASFSVSVTSSADPSFSYQWYRNNVAIPGATAARYTTLDTAMSRDGDKFHVVVTNSFGSKTSSSVNLNINSPNSNNWIGSVSNNWDDPLNWSLGRVPQGGDVVRINSGNVSMPNGTSAAHIILSRTLRWPGGALYAQVTVVSGGVLNLTGTADKILRGGGTIRNGGTINWQGGNFLLGATANGAVVVENLAGGVLDMASDNVMYYGYDYHPRVENQGTLRKSGGTNSTEIQNLDFNNTGIVDIDSGTVSFPQGLTNTGEFTGTGTAYLNGTVSGSLYGNFVAGDGLSGTFTVFGTLNWPGGALYAQVTVASGGVLNLTGNADKILRYGGTIRNGGTINWQGGHFLLGATANGAVVVENLAGGVLDMASDNVMYYGYDYHPRVENQGTLRKSGGTNSTEIQNLDFNNTGIVDIDSGTVSFPQGLTNTGEFTGTGTAYLNGTVSGSLYGNFVAGDGLSGTFTVFGTLNWPGGALYAQVTVASGGVLNLTGNADKILRYGGTIRNGGTINWQGGHFLLGATANGAVVVENLAGGVLDMASDNVMYYGYDYHPRVENQGTLRKSGGTNSTEIQNLDFNNTGIVDIDSGTVSFPQGLTNTGEFTGTGTAYLNGTVSGSLYGNFVAGDGLSGTFTVFGTLNWPGGALYAQVTVASGGVLNLTGNADKILRYGGTIRNGGTINWQGGHFLLGATANGAVVVENLAGGVLDMASDNVMYYGYDYHPRVENQGTLRKSGGTNSTEIQNLDFNNTGIVDIDSGTVSFPQGLTNTGEFTGTGTAYLNGTVSGSLYGNFVAGDGLSGTFTVFGTLNWPGGALYAQVTVASGGVLNLTGNADKILRYGGTIRNGGTINWQGGHFLLGATANGAVVVENLAGGVLDMASDNVMYYGYDYLPRVENQGTLRKSGGTNSTEIQNLVFNNTGIVDIDSGSVSISGDFTQGPTAKLQISVNPSLPSNLQTRLSVSGIAKLNGALELIFPIGSHPYQTQTYPLISFSSRSGRFSSIQATPIGPDLRITPLWTGIDFKVAITLTAFGSWKSTMFGDSASDPTISGAMKDPNGNGFPNLLEFAFGMNPTRADQLEKAPTNSFTLISNTQFLTIRFRRIVNPNARPIYRVLQTTDLAVWDDLDMQQYQVGVPVNNGDGTETVTVRSSIPVNAAISRNVFLRVAVEEN